jgi:hypothetical protein
LKVNILIIKKTTRILTLDSQIGTIIALSEIASATFGSVPEGAGRLAMTTPKRFCH